MSEAELFVFTAATFIAACAAAFTAAYVIFWVAVPGIREVCDWLRDLEQRRAARMEAHVLIRDGKDMAALATLYTAYGKDGRAVFVRIVEALRRSPKD